MRKIMMILALAASFIAAAACDRYDDGKPSKDVRNEFKAMYPDAKDVEWEREGAYWVVSFEAGTNPDRVERKAWYDASGTWIQTKTDIFLSSVPQEIKDYLAASEYGSAVPADNEAEYFESPSSDWYRFDLRLDGREVEVDVTTDGEVTLAKYDLW